MDRRYFDQAHAIRQAHPYRKGKRVMVARYEIYAVGEEGGVLAFMSAQEWEIQENILIQRGFGHRVIAVRLTDQREERLP